MYGGLSLHLGPEDRHHLGRGADGGAGVRADAAPLRGSNACADELLRTDAAAHHNSPCTDERLRAADTGAGGERADAAVGEPHARGDAERSADGGAGPGADLRGSGTNGRTGSDADGGVCRD